MNTNSQPELLTLLPKEMKTIHHVESFLLTLAKCDKLYHLDDDPRDIACFTPEEAKVVDALMDMADDVTRVHYGMENAKSPRAGLWDGIIKDLLPIGYLCFGADDSGEQLYVYNCCNAIVRTNITAWEQLKVAALEDDGESYDVDVIDEWFEMQEQVI
jgi:hypothetical protein